MKSSNLYWKKGSWKAKQEDFTKGFLPPPLLLISLTGEGVVGEGTIKDIRFQTVTSQDVLRYYGIKIAVKHAHILKKDKYGDEVRTLTASISLTKYSGFC